LANDSACVTQNNSSSNHNLSVNETSASDDDRNSPANGSLADFNVCNRVSNNNSSSITNSSSNLSSHNSAKTVRNTLDLRSVKRNHSSGEPPLVNGAQVKVEPHDAADDYDELRLQKLNNYNNNKLEQKSVSLRNNNDDCDSKLVHTEITEDDDENFHLENGDELSDNELNTGRKSRQDLTELTNSTNNNNNSLFNPKRSMDNVLKRLTSKMRGSSLGDTKRLQEQQLAAAAAAAAAFVK
jgi:hypothetical protein